MVKWLKKQNNRSEKILFSITTDIGKIQIEQTINVNMMPFCST